MSNQGKVASLSKNSYGKEGIHFLLRSDDPQRGNIFELQVDLELEGEFQQAYLQGDNSAVLPSEAMQTHALAQAIEFGFPSLEFYANRLLNALLGAVPSANRAKAAINVTQWCESSSGVWEAGGPVRAVALLVRGRELFLGGEARLRVMRPSGSSFVGFLKDPLTTQSETKDRMLYGELLASWHFTSPPHDLLQSQRLIEAVLGTGFGSESTKSVQQLLFRLGETVLEEVDELEEISLEFRSTPAMEVDLSGLGIVGDQKTWKLESGALGVSKATLRREPLKRLLKR